METFDASDSVDPGLDEDSVDIYEGLDAAGVGSNTEKWPSVGSGLKDSLDLYEDIVAEEQNNRETSYTELKCRFEAAQHQIKELHRRLQQMETQNTGLSSENNRLKKNISALLRTARQEIVRKDAEIKQLTQQVQRFHHHHQPRIKQAQDSPSSFQASSSCSSTRTLSPPSSRPLVLPPPPNPPPHFAPPISSQFEEEPPPADAPQPTSKETCHFSRSMKSSTHNCSKRHETAEKLPGVDGCTSRDREVKGQSYKLSESAERRLRDCSHHNKESEQKQAYKEDKDTRKGFDSQSHKNKKYQNVGRHCRSDGAKTSSQEHFHSAASSEHRREGRKIQRTDKASSIEHAKVSGQQSVGSCSSESRKIPRCHKYDNWSSPKNKRSSSPNQSTKRCGDGSRERERSRQRDRQRSVDRRCEDEIRSRHHRRSSQKESSRDWEKHRDKLTGRADESKEGRRETKPRDVKRSSEEPSPEANTSINDNSNRKLCFMETLNLTLSPIKKYTAPRDSSLEEPLRLEGDVDENSQPNLDNMCVIDEVDGGELGSEPGPGHAAEQALEEFKAPLNQTSNMEDGNNGGESQGRPLAALISSLWRPPQGPADTTKDLKHPEELLELISNSWITERGQLEVTKSSQPNNTPPQILAQHSSSEALTSEVHQAAAAAEHEHTAADEHAAAEHEHTAADEHAAAEHEHAAADSGEAPAPARLSQSTVSEAAASAQPDDTHGTEEVYEEARLRDGWGHQAASPGTSQPSSTSVTMDNHPIGQPQSSKDLDSVSSTICLTSLPQKGLSLTEDICAMTQIDTDPRTSSPQPSSSVDCIGVSKVSSTTEELSPATITPKKFCSQDCKKELSSFVVLSHDEDSMMHTLSNLKRIPEVISPLRSPAQTAKRGVLHVHSKLGHVKSLQKDFFTSAAETNLMKLDVNKENKYPGSPANRGAQDMVNMESEQISSPFDTELEEGEILSESDEATSSSPVPATKRAKLMEPVRNKPSLQSSSRKKSEERRVASKEPLDSAAVSTQSPRSRFKTVCPSASKASFSTVEEIMETFKMVRTEMRKKYMKLHKTFPKKSFWGVMDNFQKSFLEFVDGAHFGQICRDAEELKSKLRKLITSVFSKVLNNGIVKRIFEQQAVNLKQKLWDFVDVQVDYLLMDIQTTLKSLCQAVWTPTEDKRPGGQGTKPQQAPVKKPLCKQNKSHPPNPSLGQTKSCAVVPYRTGLGSRGKDIRMSYTEKDGATHIHPPGRINTQTTVNFLSDSNAASSPDKTKMVIPQNGSVIDRTDFELLTEQQASSLTFNLVRDSQMGEIFKCLLQGSDLLESTGMCGDNTAWAVGTPRKDGERFLNFATPSKVLSPSKSDTSARLIATWSSISPRQRSSPCTKTPIPLHPALFDESCLLEVPSGNRALLQGSLAAEKYSILAEDLAVSLTIPSPLKSDSHLSFLQPAGVGIHVVSTPDSVISAHISEDALLDGEDATEQDIHLALDNSSCSSRDSTASQTPGSTLFFKPDVPMQALVMEKSNDHFIVKIRQMNVSAEGTLIAGEPFSQTLIEKNQQHEEDDAQERLKVAGQTEKKLCVTGNPTSGSHTQGQRQTPGINPSNPRQDTSTQSGKTTRETDPSDPSSNTSSPTFHSSLVPDPSRTQLQVEATPPKLFPLQSQKQTSPPSVTLSPNITASKTLFYDSGREETTVSESEKSLTIDTSSSSEKTSRDCEQLRKRKRRQEKLKAKRCKNEDKSLQEVSPSRKNDEELKPSPAALSPSSLSAKNIIRKKGEVVMAWTRDEDRAILMFLKTKRASRETFSTLSEKLNKPSGQIAHRFYQLMKLFKKQGKMDM
ncbi:CASP8-associated protein 2 isoform X2 [Gambusia affinis]|uniref:CASP8-associated protein 2 isoform X2 n=1 Tax=Gambusia affinis TaxID=33528 RepID=UPI001CDB566E|nr:CASP8-associated protein 2 isoform X2 [Gambusia affinis]